MPIFRKVPLADSEPSALRSGRFLKPFLAIVLAFVLAPGCGPALAGSSVLLAWDHVRSEPPNLAEDPPNPAVTVLSPTWFSLSGPDGTVDSKADPAYAAEAKKRGIRVEPLFSNGFNPERTKAFLSDPEARVRSVTRILRFCRELGLDGINIDFENVFDEDRDNLTAYVGELARALHGLRLRVSIDVTVISDKPNWSACYDREALGKIVDAVVLMAYDEHWRNGPDSGPVASIGWVERSVSDLACLVPPGKIWLGIPLYTREWEERLVEGTWRKTGARALSMADAEARLVQSGATASWDEGAGAYYGEYLKGGKRYRIWLEEERSLGLKAALVGRYGLGGAAAWRRGFEKPEAWRALQNLKGAVGVGYFPGISTN
ncbi:MAG: glycosyl hydrolase family 18 protein [Synergistales bacterium]